MIRVPLIPPRNYLDAGTSFPASSIKATVLRTSALGYYRDHNISIILSKIKYQEDEIYLASWEHTRWLVLSSSFFLFPSMFAFYHHLYLHSFLLCSTSFISANYWRKPTYSWRRTLDLFFSKISFSWFFLHGIFYIHSTPHIILAVSNTCLFSSCFILSFYTYQDQEHDIWSDGRSPSTTNSAGDFVTERVWYKYHFLFHTLMTWEQFHILSHILLCSVP